MSLTLVSKKVVPVTLALAKKFRDMKPLKNERDLKAVRAKHQAKLLEEANFFSPIWGECNFDGEVFRGNGNHTSHLLTACIQQTNGGLDEKSVWFVDNYLLSKGGDWRGETYEDLPEVGEGEIHAFVESFHATDEEDLITFFRRYDDPKSTRSAGDLIGIHIGQHSDLEGLEKKKVAYALAGVRRAAGFNPEAYGFVGNEQLAGYLKEGTNGRLLGVDRVREACRWIVETVPDESLYSKVAGAQVFAEVWADHGPDTGEKIVDTLFRDLEAEKEPASSWESLLNKKRNRPTLESIVKRGRNVVKDVLGRVKKSNNGSN